MKNKQNRFLITAVCFLVMFALWTAALFAVDRQSIGPQGSMVGFASLNLFFHGLTGVHMTLYSFTDWLSILPVAVAAGFAILGLFQWIRRKRILHVDPDILILGIFYAAVFAAYIFFETVVVNYRPVLINGIPEASYPSSTTLLVLCIMPTAALQFFRRLKSHRVKRTVAYAISAYTAFMVICRLISGVHWLTDIIGGLLLSAGLVMLYCFGCTIFEK